MTGPDPQQVLDELPAPLWPALLRATRRAAGALGRPQLPPGFAPYAAFSPARLAQGRARAAVVAALATDARLRDAVGQALDSGLWQDAASSPPAELVARHGADRAAAALVARARWDDVQTVAAPVAAAVQEQSPPPSAPQPGGDQSASRAAAAALRKERDTARRRADAAEQRAAVLQEQLRTLRDRLAAAEDELVAAERRSAQERAATRDRMARLQRRISEAESRSRADAGRLGAVAAELERLAAAVRGDEPEQPAAQAPPPASAPAVPRSVRAATRGRPCVLPPGLDPGLPAAVHALLAVAGLEVVVDGYNVTKDLRGVPAAGLPQQRAWLERLLAGLVAGRDLRVSVVFDGDGDRTSAAAAGRGVRTVFTASDEIADDRIVAMVGAVPPDTPVMVVSSDREVATACSDLGANVVASGVFLQAVG